VIEVLGIDAPPAQAVKASRQHRQGPGDSIASERVSRDIKAKPSSPRETPRPTGPFRCPGATLAPEEQFNKRLICRPAITTRTGSCQLTQAVESE
jgi:hypothetical protein